MCGFCNIFFGTFRDLCCLVCSLHFVSQHYRMRACTWRRSPCSFLSTRCKAHYKVIMYMKIFSCHTFCLQCPYIFVFVRISPALPASFYLIFLSYKLSKRHHDVFIVCWYRKKYSTKKSTLLVCHSQHKILICSAYMSLVGMLVCTWQGIYTFFY